jgi:hypothetical protein
MASRLPVDCSAGSLVKGLQTALPIRVASTFGFVEGLRTAHLHFPWCVVGLMEGFQNAETRHEPDHFGHGAPKLT